MHIQITCEHLFEIWTCFKNIDLNDSLQTDTQIDDNFDSMGMIWQSQISQWWSKWPSFLQAGRYWYVWTSCITTLWMKLPYFVPPKCKDIHTISPAKKKIINWSELECSWLDNSPPANNWSTGHVLIKHTLMVTHEYKYGCQTENMGHSTLISHTYVTGLEFGILNWWTGLCAAVRKTIRNGLQGCWWVHWRVSVTLLCMHKVFPTGRGKQMIMTSFSDVSCHFAYVEGWKYIRVSTPKLGADHLGLLAAVHLN